jgi:hypothetical protein
MVLDSNSHLPGRGDMKVKVPAESEVQAQEEAEAEGVAKGHSILVPAFLHQVEQALLLVPKLTLTGVSQDPSMWSLHLRSIPNQYMLPSLG